MFYPQISFKFSARKKAVLFALAGLSLSSPFAARASTFVFKSDQGSVSFLAVGRPAFLKIRGEADGVRGELKSTDSQLHGRLSFRLDRLKTGIDLRDEHMHERYLETPKFPEATLEISHQEIPLEGQSSIPIKGSLTIKNVTLPAVGSVQRLSAQKMQARLKVNLRDYPIGVPSFQGITVANEVEIEIKSDFEVKP
jgi:polyisoprenoid-binding protein YceI